MTKSDGDVRGLVARLWQDKAEHAYVHADQVRHDGGGSGDEVDS